MNVYELLGSLSLFCIKNGYTALVGGCICRDVALASFLLIIVDRPFQRARRINAKRGWLGYGILYQLFAV